MRIAAGLCLVLAAASGGCSTADVSGQGSRFATFGTPPAGTGIGGGSIGINIQGAPVANVVFTTAVIAALLGVWRDEPPKRADPELLEGRAISEVDCTQPIGDWSKNLKCR